MEDLKYILMAKIMDGEASEEETHTFQSFLRADEDLKEAYEKLSKMVYADRTSSGISVNKTVAWQKIAMQTVDLEPKKMTFPAWGKAAVGIAAAFILGLLVFNFVNSGTQTCIAGTENKTISLPDGTVIDLKAGSRIKFDDNFAEHRNVELEGVAFFDVAKDPAHPFSIDAGEVNVTVLGTSFNIDMQENAVAVSVISGKVSVVSKSDIVDSAILLPGQGVRITGSGFSRTTLNSDGYLYWKTGVVSFNNASLKEIVEEMDRLLPDIGIVISESPNGARTEQVIKNYSYKKGISPDIAIKELCDISGCHFSKQENTYTIRTQ